MITENIETAVLAPSRRENPYTRQREILLAQIAGARSPRVIRKALKALRKLNQRAEAAGYPMIETR